MLRTFVVVCVVMTAGAALAQNLVVNPSAEEVAENGMPVGWGKYHGAGGATLTVSTEEKHSGDASACFELTKWYTREGAEDTAENRFVSEGVVLADNNGYKAQGGLECTPGAIYAFSFWYKGDIKSAEVGVCGWPSADADHTQRINHFLCGGMMSPGPQWRRCTGSFRAKEGGVRFAVMIKSHGWERDGFNLGRLYVDDAEIVPKAYPDGELRAVYWGPCAEREIGIDWTKGLKDIHDSLDQMKAAGFNTIMPWVSSLYLAALDRPELPKDSRDVYRARWDSFGGVMQAASERGMQVHAWYSPWKYKETRHAIELRDHPEWAAVNSDGVASKRGICFARPEVRQFELDLVAKLIDRYPSLAGIHIEEPGHPGSDYCYCDYCHKLCREWFGIDIREDPVAARPVLHNLNAFASTDFIVRLRQMMMEKRPEMWLSTNAWAGGDVQWYHDWSIGRDWATWARRGYIDFFVPQLYTPSVEAFTNGALHTKERIGECDLVTGMAISWSHIYPERQDPEVLKAEIRVARELGAKGFVVFNRDHFREEHYEAFREVIRERAAQ